MTQTNPLPVDILLVDDRPENLLALEATLSSAEYRLVKAASGDEALRYLLDNEPAVILMDVQMPELDGFETASIIKSSERTRDIPIIFLTAINKEERFVSRGYDEGAVDYISKPFDPQALRSKVRVFADLFRKSRSLLEAERLLRESEQRDRLRELAQLELKALKRDQAQQRKYRDLVDGINHGIVWSADASTLHFTFVSPSAERILGFEESQWLNDPKFFEHCSHPDDLESLEQAIARVRTECRDVRIEHRVIDRNGEIIWLHTAMKKSRTHDEQSHEIHGLSIDVTRLKKTEEALRRSKERSDFLAEASLLLSRSLDQEEILSQVSRLAVPRLADWFFINTLDDAGALKNLAIEHKDATKVRLVRELMAEHSENPPLNHYHQSFPFGSVTVFRTGKPEIYPDIPASALGSEMLKSLGLRSALCVPLIARDRTLATMTLILAESERSYDQEDLVMAEDLARRIAAALENARLYREAQLAIRSRDEFLSIASHELKTPLTPIKLQTQGLMRLLHQGSIGNVKPERIEKALQVTDRQLTKLAQLIEDMLDLSRINGGKLNLQFEPFDFQTLVKEVLERFEEQLSTSKCEVTLKTQGPVQVMQDRFRVEQVIVNLLTNAMKYGSGKPIEISLFAERDTIRLSVRDHGIGISKNDQSRIFERFERAVPVSHFGGLGLGLYIVSQILKALGGSIQVQSEPGDGAIFTVSLPLEGIATGSPGGLTQNQPASVERAEAR